MPSRNWTYCPALPTSIALRRGLAKADRAVIATAYTRIGSGRKSAERRWVTSRSIQLVENDKGREGDRGSGQQVAERGAEEEAEEAQGWGMEETCYWAGRKGGAIEH